MAMSIDLSYKIHHVFTIKTIAIPLLHGDVDVTWVMNKWNADILSPQISLIQMLKTSHIVWFQLTSLL